MKTTITKEMGLQFIKWRESGMLLKEMQARTGIDNREISKYLIKAGHRKQNKSAWSQTKKMQLSLIIGH